MLFEEPYLEILIYKITMIFNMRAKKKFLWWSWDNSTKIELMLHYRVAEDRFWFTRKDNGQIIDSHHMKNNLQNSIMIMEKMKERIQSISLSYHQYKPFDDKTLKCEYYDIRKADVSFIYNEINRISRDVTIMEKEKRNPLLSSYNKIEDKEFPIRRKGLFF